MAVVEQATFFKGKNAYGNDLIGSVTGEHSPVGLQNLTPQGSCKENGCSEGPNGSRGGRPNNSVICPITSSADHIYATLTGGGLFIINAKTIPMSILSEYGREVVYGAGCGAMEVTVKMFVNSGVVGSVVGAVQSFRYSTLSGCCGRTQGANRIFFTCLTSLRSIFPDANFSRCSRFGLSTIPFSHRDRSRRTRRPRMLSSKILEIRPQEGTWWSAGNTGQNPGMSTRLDSHGATSVVRATESYVHITDRIQGTSRPSMSGPTSGSPTTLHPRRGEKACDGSPGRAPSTLSPTLP
jgi:hypothetical protein